MIAAFIAMLVIAVIFIFLVPWVGILAGIVALILLVLFLVGVGRGVTRQDQPSPRA
jgi:ABC-type antimicrobial peptide transport system permease subunit